MGLLFLEGDIVLGTGHPPFQWVSILIMLSRLLLDPPGPCKSRLLAEFPFGAKIKIKKGPGFASPWKTKVLVLVCVLRRGSRVCTPLSPG